MIIKLNFAKYNALLVKNISNIDIMSKNIYYQAFHDTGAVLTACITKSDLGYTAPHFHRSIEIIYVLNGVVKCNIDGESFDALENDIIFTKRCGIHEFYYGYKTDTLLLVITPKYSDDFDFIFQSKTIPCHLSDTEFNKTLLKYLTPLAKQTETSDMVIKGLVNVIIGKLFEHYPTTPIENSASMDLIIDVLNYIDRHYKEQLTLDVISSKFGYNKYYFSRLFNDSIGTNLNNYINGVRLRNLMNDARKIEKPNFSQLILDYGFDSFSTFYRTCYLNFNMSPKEILKSAKLE